MTLTHMLLIVELMEKQPAGSVQRIKENQRDAIELAKRLNREAYDAMCEVSRNQALVGRRFVEREASKREFKFNPLNFVISGVRISNHFERILRLSDECADFYRKGNIRADLFRKERKLNLLLNRLITATGMIVEYIVEEKERFYGSIPKVTQEIRRICLWYFVNMVRREGTNRREFADLSMILHNFLIVSEDFASIFHELKTLY